MTGGSAALGGGGVGVMAQHEHGVHEGGSNAHDAASRKPWLMRVLEKKWPALWYAQERLCATIYIYMYICVCVCVCVCVCI